jgi:hypothetical protein
MSQFWDTKNFKKLAKTWDKKLKQSGFKDAEISLKGDRALKQRATNSYRQANELEREARLEYFSIMGKFAHNTCFNNLIEQHVMIRHSEGSTIKEILKELWKLKRITRNRKTIRFIIRRWQNKWGVKIWTLKQMNLKK